MNEQQEFTMLDILNILSFFIGILNLQENLTQNDKQDLINTVNKRTKIILDEVQKHLEIQDKKLDIILEKLL